MSNYFNYIYEVSIGGVGILIGGYITNRYNIGRDKRKELNTLTDPLRQKIKNQIVSLQTLNKTSNSVKQTDFETIYDHLNMYQAHTLKTLVKRYDSNFEELYKRDGYGAYTPNQENSSSRLIKDLESILVVLRWR